MHNAITTTRCHAGARKDDTLDAIHSEQMKRIGKYRELKPGDQDFDRIAAEIYARREQHQENDEMGKPVKTCRKCGQPRTITGRGLCSTCYGNERINGTLNANYPTSHRFGGKTGQSQEEPMPEKQPESAPESEPAPQFADQAEDSFAATVDAVLAEIRTLLLAKNAAYGNSALQPVRIFSTADPAEQLRVRIDDKLSRLMRGHAVQGEDTEKDLLGYLVLLQVYRKHQIAAEAA